MSLALYLFALVSAAGALAVLNIVRSTSEGYEDETGFHFTESEANALRRSRVVVPVTSTHCPVHF